MVHKLLRDESGMTMGLAIMMVLLISVMGAGILTFASRDLNTVAEQNRGQRAFEVADAGIAAAKRQISSDCGGDPILCRSHYDGVGEDDFQWSAGSANASDPNCPSGTEFGMCLYNLDDSSTTADRVNVTIAPFETDSFKVISTGTYGASEAKRKIEAIFKGESEVPLGGSGDGGHPIYYTKSSIQIEGPMKLQRISMFSEQDILLNNQTGTLNDPTAFLNDYNNTGGVIDKIATGGGDWLGNWDSTKNPPYDPPGNWNTVPRQDLYNPTGSGQNVKYPTWVQPGFAAQETICGYTTPSGTCTGSSIADGVYNYDKTTGTNLCTRDESGNPVPNPDYQVRPSTTPAGKAWPVGWTFCEKPEPPNDVNVPGTLSYPFPRPTPKAKNLWQLAKDQEANHYKDPTDSPSFYKHYWDVGTQGPPDWDALMPACPPEVTSAGQNCYDRAVFIDADRTTVQFEQGGNPQGILVVWCGRLEQRSQFQGIVFSLVGDGSGFGASSCTPEDPGFPGTYRNVGGTFLGEPNALNLAGWLYAEGGTLAKAGIELGPNSSVSFLPGADWNLINDLLEYQGAPPTTFKLQSWRELYQDAP